MQELNVKIKEIIKRTPDVTSFRFEVPGQIEFKAGQFFQLTIKVGGKEESKYFSFSNSPTEKGYIEFTKRITGSSFSQELLKLKKGDTAHVKMPLGTFILGEEKKIAFLSGGIGITPIRSMCKFASDTNKAISIVLMYSNRRAREIPFKEDFDRMKSENIRVIYAVTDEEKHSAKEMGLIFGRINADMIKKEIPDYKDRVFYVCGPPGMVEALTGILKNELLLEEKQVRKENFAGY